ncbi:uncharacterized protein BO72DRAFT_339008, partial [Aspergillus fijiensis CBS 313.89]
MPRLSTRTILQAYAQDALLPLLLRECRTVDSARSELRWLRQHAIDLTQQRKEQRYRRLQQARKTGQASEGPHSPRNTQPHRKPTHRHAPENALPKGWRRTLRTLCRARSRGTPLQYLLGDQPFGDLTILCQKGVLIPRNDTETFTYAAAEQIRQHFPPPKPEPNPASPPPSLSSPSPPSPSPTTTTPPNPSPAPSRPPQPLRILDLCTGTGCITLLLHALLSPSYPSLKIVGIDIHPPAIRLAQKNLRHNITLGDLPARASQDVEFRRADVLACPSAPTSHSKLRGRVPALEELLPYIPDFWPRAQDASKPNGQMGREGEGEGGAKVEVDVIISNPPYISRTAFLDGTTARSVRFHEPVLALVPPSPASQNGMVEGLGQGQRQGEGQGEDVFYARIVGLAGRVGARMVVFECGDYEQGGRVVELCRRGVTARKLGGRWEVGIWE